ncbi:MAG: helix-turn-helix domain-containing protein [Eubacteriales bacterium]
MEKLMYNVKEVAAVLGISKSYAYQLVKERKLPVLELGNRKVIPKLALERWIEENVNM